MQLNCNGLRDKLQEILRFMQMNNILVAALQETNLSQLCSLTAPEYNIVRKDRMSNRGGGFAFLIHNSIQYSVAHLPAHTAHDNVM